MKRFSITHAGGCQDAAHQSQPPHGQEVVLNNEKLFNETKELTIEVEHGFAKREARVREHQCSGVGGGFSTHLLDEVERGEHSLSTQCAVTKAVARPW